MSGPDDFKCHVETFVMITPPCVPNAALLKTLLRVVWWPNLHWRPGKTRAYERLRSLKRRNRWSLNEFRWWCSVHLLVGWNAYLILIFRWWRCFSTQSSSAVTVGWSRISHRVIPEDSSLPPLLSCELITQLRLLLCLPPPRATTTQCFLLALSNTAGASASPSSASLLEDGMKQVVACWLSPRRVTSLALSCAEPPWSSWRTPRSESILRRRSRRREEWGKGRETISFNSLMILDNKFYWIPWQRSCRYHCIY
jgi:hypothetical protein